MVLPAHSGSWPLIQFRNHFSQTVGLLGRVISSSQGLYLNTGQHKHRINAYTHQTSMPCVGLEPTNPASNVAKAVHALDRTVTMISLSENTGDIKKHMIYCSRDKVLDVCYRGNQFESKAVCGSF
jgi:hypothetical protein